MSGQTLLIPCETFSVDAVLVPSETLTTLERLVLKALDAGIKSVEDLNELFAIGYRPMLQLLLDLLDRSLVTFDFSKGEVQVSSDVHKKIEANALDEIEPIARTPEQIKLMRDLVSGSIMVRRGQPPVQPATRLKPLLEPNSVKSINPESVALAIRTEVRKRLTHAGRPMHVLEIAFDPRQIKGEMRDLELSVRASVDVSTDRLIVTVVGPEDLPARNRARIEKTLNDLANVDKPDLALKNLRDAASTSEVGAQPSLTAEIRKLREQVDGLRFTDRGTYAGRHSALNNLAASIEEAILRQHGGDVHATFITDQTVLANTVDEMIRSARRQIVIACPGARYEAMARFRDGLECVLREGRRIFLLFGRQEQPPDLEAGVRTSLHRLAESYPDQLFFSDEESARCNGKFVIADGADVLVTSRDFLTYAPNGPTTGLRLTANAAPQQERRPVLPITADLLRIAKQIFPDPITAQDIAAVPHRLGFVQTALPIQSETPQLPPTSAANGDTLDASRVSLWLRQWERRTTELERWAAKVGTSYELICDDAHLQLLFDAFRTATRSLFVGADTITDASVSRRFIDELTECLRRASVMIHYRKCDPRAMATLQNLVNAGFSLKLQQWNSAGPAPRLLLCDEWALITSFDFGSPPRNIAARSTEIGIRADGPAAVEAIRSAFSAVLPTLRSWQAPAASRPPIDASPVPVRSVHTLLADIENALPADKRPVDAVQMRYCGEVLRSWFGAADDSASAWAELEDLDAVSVPFLDQAIATCLDIYRDNDEQRMHWLRRLTEVRWQQRDYAGVVLLLAGARDLSTPSLPPPSIALLTAGVAAGSATEDAFADAALNVSDPASAIAVAALTIPLAIFEADGRWQALPVVRDKLPAPLQRWCDAVSEFRTLHPTGVRRTEFDAVAAQLQGDDRRQAGRKSLQRELQQFLDEPPTYELLKLVKGRLVGGSKGFKELRTAAANGDTEFVRQFVADTVEGGAALLQSTIDELANRGDWFGKAEIFLRKREKFVAHLDAIINAARAWIADIPAATKKIDRLADALKSLSASLRHDAEAVGALELENSFAAPLVGDLRNELKPLLELPA